MNISFLFEDDDDGVFEDMYMDMSSVESANNDGKSPTCSVEWDIPYSLGTQKVVFCLK
jgi:hypothetical protein